MRKTLGNLTPIWGGTVADYELEQTSYSPRKMYGFLPIGIKKQGNYAVSGSVSNENFFFRWTRRGTVVGRHTKLLLALEMVSVERVQPSIPDRMPGRPLKHRATLARAFLAKMVYAVPTTTALMERVRSDPIRRMCWWEPLRDVLKDIFARVRGVCGGRSAGSPACGVDRRGVSGAGSGPNFA